MMVRVGVSLTLNWIKRSEDDDDDDDDTIHISNGLFGQVLK